MFSAASISNRLLLGLAMEDFDPLRPHLEHVPLRQKQTLSSPNTPIDLVYFPQVGWCRLFSLWRTAQ